MIGHSLAHFEITAKLGEGGMGEVYRATDSKLGREVAVKVLPAAFTEDSERLARFEREARVLASVSHPNIAGVFEVGEAQGTHFLVMELARGETLAQRIARGPVPVEEARRIALEMAAALETAHARGIVHRDLKPANVMIGPEGEVKVLDFGLAKAWESAPAVESSVSLSPTLTAQMTQVGLILGTAAYMSPEQARGREADQRSDIWSWGVILWEMLTGEGLFAGSTVSDTLAAVLRADPDFDRLPATTPPTVRTVLRRCLVREPADRLHAIADARIELTDAEDVEAQPTDAAASGRWRPLAAVAVAAALVAVAAAAWLAWTRDAGAAAPLRVLELDAGDDLEILAISPDGGKLAIVRGGRLFVRDLDSQVERPLPGVGDVDSRFTLFWSPDSRQIGYTTPDAIYRVPVDGGTPTRLCEIPDHLESEGTVLGGTWRDDDTIVFSLSGAIGLLAVPTRGGEPTLVLAPDRGEGEFALHAPRLLPDGRTLVSRVLPWRDANRDWDGFVFLRDGVRSEVRYPGWRLDVPIVSESGHLVFLRSRSGEGRGPQQTADDGVWAAPFSLRDLQPTGEPVRILDGSFDFLSISADDTLVVGSRRGSSEDVAVVDRTGTVIRPVGVSRYIRDPAASPDGRQLAFSAIFRVYVYNGTRIDQIEPNGMEPTWSPDSRELIYGNRDGLYREAADGSGEATLIVDRPGARSPHWSADGRTVAFWAKVDRPEEEVVVTSFGRRETGQGDVFLAPADGGEPRPLLADSRISEIYPRFSPDGRFLAFASDESGRLQIYVTELPDAKRRWAVSVGTGRFPRWSPAGDEIYWTAGSRLMGASFSAEDGVEVGAPREVLSTRQPGLAVRSFQEFGQAAYDITPDGHFVVMRHTFEQRGRATLVQNWTELLQRKR